MLRSTKSTAWQQYSIGSKLVGLFLLLLLSTQAAALSSDKDQPIEVDADGVELDDNKGTQIFSGDVIITQGSFRVTADKVTVIRSNDKTDKIVAIGKPVKFKQRQDGKKTDVRGQALRIEYFADSEIVDLINKARVTQDGDVFASDRIRYNRKKSLIQGGSKAGGKQRIKIRIQSKNLK
ncbi:MAG: lipopolysaccharide transport periplasmic protein LptA [gamma proteobacterium symbiont of Bathyaustriella thionipta]|nr:lipopolysaccharide transport periplasmic protein LptA [gamma proteobacterium symbiont of Bathyaustriella thionipta]